MRLILLIFLLFPFLAQADAPKVGRRAAAKYFEKDAEVLRSPAQSSENILMLHLGRYVNSQAYQWKDNGKQEDVAKATYGVTYLFDQWNSLDVNIRADFSEFLLSHNSRAVKLSLMPVWTFPRAETRFPLYFGFGAGLGIFFQQVENESNLSLDYQLMMGARFMDILESVGFFIEFGLKNHLHILSDGQLNGTALNAGAIFTF